MYGFKLELEAFSVVHSGKISQLKCVTNQRNALQQEVDNLKKKVCMWFNMLYLCTIFVLLYSYIIILLY